jgi:predicted acetyltransferase
MKVAPRAMLVMPAPEHLDSYRTALERQWSPDNVRGAAAAREQLEAIARDSRAFLRALDDPEGKGPSITLPDGIVMSRLPGITRWIWDGEFVGSINFRWQRNTSALPPNVLGHIGFAVVPWFRGRGYAKFALAKILEEARAQQLDYVELTVSPDNTPSQRVITANGATLVERFCKDDAYGGGEALRFRIRLN